MAKTKQTFDINKHCGGGKHHSCKMPKGSRTTHPGSGRCWKHGGIKKGGDKRIKHGLYSGIGSASLQAAMAKVRASQTDPLDLIEEVILLRSLTMDYIERFEDYKAQLARFDASFAPAMQMLMAETNPKKVAEAVTLLKQQIVQRPKNMLDISGASILVERLGRMVERVHLIRKASTITLEVFDILMDRMALIMIKFVKEGIEGTKKKTAREIIQSIRAAWAEIDVPVSSHPSSSGPKD